MAGESPVAVGERLELFVDDEIVDCLDGTWRQLHEPRPAGVAVRADRRWEGMYNWGFQVIVDGDRFRMYYRARPEVGAFPWLRALCCAESSDGKAWFKPNLWLVELDGDGRNNVCAIRPAPDDSDAGGRDTPFRVPGGGRSLLVSTRIRELSMAVMTGLASAVTTASLPA